MLIPLKLKSVFQYLSSFLFYHTNIYDTIINILINNSQQITVLKFCI